jgi:UDP-glucose 4-epimerase
VPTERADRRAGDPSTLYASSARIGAELGWTPSFVNLDRIVETAWTWRHSHPHGFQAEAQR